MPRLVPIHEHNDCHNPAGPAGGQFCSMGGTLTNVQVHGPRSPYPRGAGRPGVPAHVTEVPDGFWVITSDQGWVELSTSKRYMGPHLVVASIYIKEDLRGQGLGQALYLEAAKQAKVIGKATWPRYRGIVSGADVRSTAATQAWQALKKKYPKRVKRVRGRQTTYEVLE